MDASSFSYQPDVAPIVASSLVMPLAMPEPIDRALERQTFAMLSAQANLARRARLVAAAATSTDAEGFAARSTLVVRRLVRREVVPG